MTFCFNRMVRRLTWRGRRRSGWPLTLLILSVKTSGCLTLQILINLITASGAWCWQQIRTTCPNQPVRLNWSLCCRPYGTVYHKTPSIRQSWSLENGCRRVWRLMRDTLNMSSYKCFIKNCPFQVKNEWKTINLVLDVILNTCSLCILQQSYEILNNLASILSTLMKFSTVV